MNAFFSSVSERQAAINSLLCVGLDPDLHKIPKHYLRFERPIFQFIKDVIEVTKEVTCCYKPQFAHFAAADALVDLKEIVALLRSEDLPVILDAKRGDVGSTAEYYAREAFDIYNAGAVTVNPYLGGDSILPFLDRPDRGVILLCRTSNRGGVDIQNQRLAEGGELYEHVAHLASSEWNARGNVGLVVGATRPEELSRVRSIVGDMFLLLPGLGAQRADVSKCVVAAAGGGLIISSSRAILYPDDDSIGAIKRAAIRARDEIEQHRK